MFGVDTKRLREDLRAGDGDIRRRRAIIGVSLVGIVSMAAVTLLQTGLIKHLPDPPLPGFDSDKVTLSEDAYRFGSPDAPLAVATLAANLPLAAFGEAERAKKQPLIPLLAAAKAALDTAISGWYFHRMLFKERALCSYCILGSIADVGVLALSVPEAVKALREMRKNA